MPEVDDVAAALQRLHQLTIAFPFQSLVVGSRHDLAVAVDPGLIRALEEGSAIDGAVDQQAIGRALLGVAVARDLALGLDAIADGRGADEIAHLEEAELEGARDRRRTGRPAKPRGWPPGDAARRRRATRLAKRPASRGTRPLATRRRLAAAGACLAARRRRGRS